MSAASSRPRGTRAPRRVRCFCSPSNRPGYPAEHRSRRSAARRSRPACGCSPMRSTSTDLRRGHGPVDAGAVPELGLDRCSSSTGWPEDLRDDRVAGGLGGRSRRRREGGEDHAVATRPRTSPTCRRPPRSRRDRRPVGRRHHARGLRPAPADDRVDAARDPGVACPGRRALRRLPLGQGPARPPDRRGGRPKSSVDSRS